MSHHTPSARAAWIACGWIAGPATTGITSAPRFLETDPVARLRRRVRQQFNAARLIQERLIPLLEEAPTMGRRPSL